MQSLIFAWELTRLIIMYCINMHVLDHAIWIHFALLFFPLWYPYHMIQYKILRITFEWLHKKGVCDLMAIFKRVVIIYIINILQFHCVTVRVDNIFYEYMEIEYSRTPLIQIYWFASEIWTSEFRNTSLHLNPEEG